MSHDSNEGGFTMVEILVSIFVFAVVSAGFYQVLLAQTRGSDVARSVVRMSDEASFAFNRMVRDTREADSISAASTSPMSYTVKVNFNGDAYYENPNAQGDYEILTFAYDAATNSITLNGETLMAGVVSACGKDMFTYSSNFLEYDWNDNGVTTWQEIDQASTYGVVGVGNNDGILNSAEFPYLTTVSYAVRMGTCAKGTDFYATSQLRNRV